MLDKLTVDDFLIYINETFCIKLPESKSLELELIEVNKLGGNRVEQIDGDNKKRRPFSVLFRGPSESSCLPQSIYPVEHHKMGKLNIFLVPLGQDKKGMLFEAVFN